MVIERAREKQTKGEVLNERCTRVVGKTFPLSLINFRYKWRKHRDFDFILFTLKKKKKKERSLYNFIYKIRKEK